MLIKEQEDMIARSLFVESKKLRIFDFDETLAFTKSYIYVKKLNGTEVKLTPGEFAVYKEKPGEEYDFRDFHSVQEPEELKRITKVLKTIIQKNGGDGVFILTARPQSVEPHIHKYLKDIGINYRIPVVGLQSNNPKDKADWIEKKIDNEGYDDVYFADDSLKNVEAAKKMLRTKDVRWRVQHIKH
jgi:phosphoglycolate phosphatase-like HAD superfamily hydrolase